MLSLVIALDKTQTRLSIMELIPIPSIPMQCYLPLLGALCGKYTMEFNIMFNTAVCEANGSGLLKTIELRFHFRFEIEFNWINSVNFCGVNFIWKH